MLPLLWIACFYLCLLSLLAELQHFEHSNKSEHLLSFLVVGDWGRRGAYNQSAVARQMGVIGGKLHIDFVISTGDNFYDNGLKSVRDTAFVGSFSKIYTAQSLQKQWYSVLGNHDYRGDVLAQLSPSLRKIDPRWLCMRSFLLNTGTADFFFIDTTPLVDSYFTRPKNRSYDWRGVLPRRRYIWKQLKELRRQQRHSSAKWKIVIGHHTIRSIGYHADTEELVKKVLPILRANKVDMYINGHDHCLEHINDSKSPIVFLTSGAGSKAWRGDIHDDLHKRYVKFYYDGQGFMSVRLSMQSAEIVFYNVYGKVLYKLNLSKK